jgi:hypothetical protein
MATYYSDHYSANGLQADSYDGQMRVNAGIGHGRLRYKRAQATPTSAGTGDTIRMLTFKSGDRLIELMISTDGNATGGTIDLGMFLSGSNHDGASLGANNINSFMDAAALTTIGHRTDAFGETGASAITVATENEVRGLTMWEIANFGDGAYTVDPMTSFDIVITPTVAFDAANIVTLEAYYTAGD